MYNDEILSPGRRNTRRDSASSVDEHHLERSGRRRRSSSLLHSLTEKLSEKENSPPNSRRSSRRRMTSNKLSEHDEDQHSRHSSPKHSARGTRTRSVSKNSGKGSLKDHEKSPPNSHRRRSTSSRKSFDHEHEDDDVQQNLPSSPKVSPRKRARSMSGASIKRSPEESKKRDDSPPNSLPSSRRKSVSSTRLANDHHSARSSTPPTPKLSDRQKSQSLSQTSPPRTPHKERRKSSTGILKSGPASLRASKEDLHAKSKQNSVHDSSGDVETLPLYSNRSRSMSAGNKSTDKNDSRRSSKTIYQRPSSHFDLTNSIGLRSSAYQDWLQRKLQEDKRKRAVSAKTLKEQQEKQKEKDLKKIDALATYESWKREKDVKIKQKLKREKAKQEKKQLDQKEEKEQKLRDAEKLFHVWKGEKDKVLKEKAREKLRKKDEEKEKKEEEFQKKKDAEIIFKRWKENKDQEIINVVKAIKTIHKERDNVVEMMQNEKDIKAAEAYEAWLRKKEVERIDTLNASFNENDMEPKIPWLPPNKTTMSTKATRMTKIRK